ncbi:cytochrome C [Marinifilum sp. JC120]|nr:cytochrome C [Marinifilum sp. JC120]
MANKQKAGRHRLRWLKKGSVYALLCIFVAVGAGAGTIKNEGDGDGNGLCLSCHTMKQTVFPEFKKTKHFSNPSGVRAKCSSCHVPQAVFPMLKRKAASLTEIVSWMKGTIDTPEKFEKNRLRLAKNVWKDFKENDSRECKNCHHVEAFDFAAFKKADSVKTMKKGLEEGQTCIDCHKGIAHTMPDLSAGFRMLYEEIKEDAQNGDFNAEAVYPISITSCYMEKDGPKAGRVLPLTKLEVIETSGDWAKVRIQGWQQVGAERVICEKSGRRIFSVALSKSALDKVISGPPIVDTDTGLCWNTAEFDCWIKGGQFLSDINRLNEYGSELHSAACGGCHAQTPATHFTANQWIGGIKSMGNRVSLSKNNARFLLKYLQLRASDIVGQSHS